MLVLTKDKKKDGKYIHTFELPRLPRKPPKGRYGYMIEYTEDPEEIKRISFYRDRVLWDDSRRCQWAARRLASFDRMVAATSEEELEKERDSLYFGSHLKKLPCKWCQPGELCRGCYEYLNYD